MKQGANHSVTIKLSEETITKLAKEAGEHGRSTFIRQIIHSFLNSPKNTESPVV
jgi:predicted DNA binding CopG/RHH family protein